MASILRQPPRVLSIGTRDLDPSEVRLSGYALGGVLERGPLGPRYLATRERDGEQVVLHAARAALRRGVGRLSVSGSTRDAKRFRDLVSPLRCLGSSHVLPIEDVVTDVCDAHWLVTPFVGSFDGLLDLESLRSMKRDGQLDPMEAGHAARHLLDASIAAHGAGVAHGVMSADEVLIDRRGSLVVELYGVRRRLLGLSDAEDLGEVSRSEVRSIVGLTYTLLTGTLEVPEPFIAASRLSKRVDAAWDRWLAFGLDPSHGFASASEALEHIPAVGEADHGGDALPSPKVRTARVRVSAGASRETWRRR